MTALEIPQTLSGYAELMAWLDDLKVRTKAGSEYVDAYRWYSKNDLYFLFRHVLLLGRQIHQPFGTPIYDNQLYVDMARSTEYQIKRGRGLNSSTRRIGKSELRSCAAVIYLLINYPDAAIGLVSVEKALGFRHMDRVRHELERNELLKFLFSDIFWEDPMEQAKSHGLRWSRADGIVIKGRTSNRQNASLEVNALFGGGPVGSGYDIIIADDIERSDRVKTAAGIDELDAAFSEAISLLTPFVVPRPILLISNTRFSEQGLINRKFIEYEAEDPGLVFEVPAEVVEEGKCDKYVYNDDVGPRGGRINYPFTQEYLTEKFLSMAKKSEYDLQFALSFKNQGDLALDDNLLHFYDGVPAELGAECVTYVCIDPSKGKHDPSAMVVWGLTHDKRKILLDATVSKLDITGQPFHDEVFRLVSKWSNLSRYVAEVRVEDTANSDWAALVERELIARGSWVTVVKCRVTANMAEKKFTTGKADRIYQRWAPSMKRGDIWFPLPVTKGGRGLLCDMDRTGNDYKDLISYVINVEMKPFPVASHDDFLDAGGLIEDEKVNQDHPLQWPSAPRQKTESDYNFVRHSARSPGWMSAG